MAISAKQVMDLRAKTGVAMMACKKALVETDGDMDAAIDILRKKGVAKAAAKADRATPDGAVFVSGRSVVGIGCETDFVAKSDQFVAAGETAAATADSDGVEAAKTEFDAAQSELVAKLGENIVFIGAKSVVGGTTVAAYVHSNKKAAAVVALDGGNETIAKDIAMHIVASSPTVLSPADVDTALIDKEKETWREQLLNEGKPEQIIDKILQGKVNKFCAQTALLTQPFIKNPDLTVEALAKAGDAKIVEFVMLTI